MPPSSPSGDSTPIQPVLPKALTPVAPPDHVLKPSAPIPAEPVHAVAPPEPEHAPYPEVLPHIDNEAVPFTAHAPDPGTTFSANDKLPDIEERHYFVQKLSAAGVAILVHVALAILLFTVYVVMPQPKSAEITAIAAPVSDQQVPETKKVVEQPPQPQVTQATTSARLMTAVGASSVPLPNIEFEAPTDNVDLGTMMGNFDANFGSTGTAMTVTMFGKKIENVKKIAVVMDVSRSMTRYLPVVVDEMRKIGRTSPLVLYFGCWLNPINDLEPVFDVVEEEEHFKKFWQYWQGSYDMGKLTTDYEGLEYDKKQPFRLEDVYKKVAKRKDTYFIDRFGDPKYRKTSVMSALLAKEIKDADTIYWLADFQDAINDDAASYLIRRLRGRGVRLFIHAPHANGRSLEKVKEELVKPLKGEAIVLDL